MATAANADAGRMDPLMDVAATLDHLNDLFPGIERFRIQDILVNHCNNDSAQAVVVLTKLQLFNQGVTSSTKPKNIAVDGVASRIETQGLDPIDYRMYSIAFFLFSALTIYMELGLKWFKDERHQTGHYYTAIGLVLIMVASFREFAQIVCISALSRKDRDRRNKCGRIRGILYIIGGLLYFLGYMIHVMSDPVMEIHNDDAWIDRGADPQKPYFVGRGIFVGLHFMFIGYLYVTNGRIPKCIAARSVLIRFWLTLQVIFIVLVFQFMLEPENRWMFMLVFMLSTPFIFLAALLLSCCLYPVWATKLSWIMMISWSLMLVMSAIYVFNEDLYGKEEVTYLMAIFLFESFMLWILVRAMRPVTRADDGKVKAVAQRPWRGVVPV